MVKEKEEIKNYDLYEGLNKIETSKHLKKGFEYYLTHNNKNIKNDASLNREFKKYLNRSVGA